MESICAPLATSILPITRSTWCCHRACHTSCANVRDYSPAIPPCNAAGPSLVPAASTSYLQLAPLTEWSLLCVSTGVRALWQNAGRRVARARLVRVHLLRVLGARAVKCLGSWRSITYQQMGFHLTILLAKRELKPTHTQSCRLSTCCGGC